MSQTKVTRSVVVEANGANTLVTPEAGKSLTLYWIALETSEGGASEVLAEVKLGTQTPYTWFLGKPGAFMHRETVIGELNGALSVTLSAAVKVAVSYTFTEG